MSLTTGPTGTESPVNPIGGCGVCFSPTPKYTCPRCQLRTCSLTCCVRHKQMTGCTGKRETTKYVRREEYGTFDFLSDYRLLEEVDRKNAQREKELMILHRKFRARPRNVDSLQKLTSSLGITLRMSGCPLLKRSASNRTRVSRSEDCASEQIYWSVEFGLLPSTFSATSEACRLTNLSQVSMLRLLVHSCPGRTRLAGVWNERVLQLPTQEQQDALITQSPTESVPFGQVACWLDSRRSRRFTTQHSFYFYVQTESLEYTPFHSDAKTSYLRRYPKVEVFPTTRLNNIFSTPGFVVHELPTIYVSLNKIDT